MNRLVAVTLFGISTFALASCTTDEAPQTQPPPPVVDPPVDPPPPPPTDGFPEVAEPCAEELDLFVRTVWVPTVSVKCTGCHNATGVAAATRLRLIASSEPEDMLANYQMLGGAAVVDADGTPLLLSKPTALHADGHTGGAVLAVGSEAYEALEHFAHVATDPTCNMERPPGPDCDTAEPSPRMIRRLTHEEYALTLVSLFAETSTSISELVADPRVDGYANDASALVVSPLLADQYRTNAEAIAGSMVHKLNDYLPCSLSSPSRNPSRGASPIAPTSTGRWRRVFARRSGGRSWRAGWRSARLPASRRVGSPGADRRDPPEPGLRREPRALTPHARGARGGPCVRREHLLTPAGLRTLAPSDPGYQPRFEGDMIRRDRAYHNGTVWPWLIGAYAEAVLAGRRVLGGVEA